MIAIVDSALGNLTSVRNALRAVGAEAILTSDPALIRHASGVILPGQGAAPVGMKRLRERGLDDVIRQLAAAGRPILGICLGMQLLFEYSEEGDTPCLGLVPGSVRLLSGNVKIPHIGWNQVLPTDSTPLWSDLPPRPYFYFVHSYYCQPSDSSLAAGTTEYGSAFCSALVQGRLWGTQFHPERSGRAGLQLLRNFVDSCVQSVDREADGILSAPEPQTISPEDRPR